MDNICQTYWENQILTSSKESLVGALFSGVAKFTKQAAEACANGNYEETNYLLLKAQAILQELMSTLNRDAGEMVDDMLRLYDYMHHRLVEANIKKEPAMIREVHDLAGELREAWAEALRQSRD